jgi:hypothetical protein
MDNPDVSISYMQDIQTVTALMSIINSIIRKESKSCSGIFKDQRNKSRQIRSSLAMEKANQEKKIIVKRIRQVNRRVEFEMNINKK